MVERSQSEFALTLRMTSEPSGPASLYHPLEMTLFGQISSDEDLEPPILGNCISIDLVYNKSTIFNCFNSLSREILQLQLGFDSYKLDQMDQKLQTLGLAMALIT